MIHLDPAVWPGHGRRWSHLISDVSFAELHAFAELLGIPARGFDGDHYDIPAARYPVAIWLGARPASSREIVRMLLAAGLRRPKHLRPPGGSLGGGEANSAAVRSIRRR